MFQPNKELYEFDGFRLDVTERILSLKGERVPLAEKAFETLCALVKHGNHLVGKDELMTDVWADAIVEENSLDKNISYLRKALGEKAEKTIFIETVRGHGYRFLPEVRSVKDEHENDDADPAALAKQSKVVADFPIADRNYETQRSGNVVAVAKWRREEIENTAESHADDEAEERRDDVVTQPREEREIAPDNLSKFLTSVKQNKRLAFFVLICFAILIVAGFALSRLFDRRRLPAGTAIASPASNRAFKRLTPDVSILHPVISPDGKYLAYIQSENNKYSIWLKDIATGGTVQLLPPTDEGYDVHGFSPDGTQLFYSNIQPNTPNWTIFRLTLANGERQAIVGNDISPSAVSPDGKQLVFISGKYDLMIVNTDGSGKRVLRHPEEGKGFVAWDSQLSWSPDGTRIAVCGTYSNENGRNGGELIEVFVSDGSERRIATPSNWRDIDDVAWLPDESGLLVTARETEGEPFQIWRVSSPDGTAIRITNDNHDYNWISLSRDAELLIAEQGLGHFNVWTAPLSDTKNIKQLTLGSAASDGYYGIAFMPDGRLVYSSTRSGNVDLWVMNADGSNQRQLTANAGSWNSKPCVTQDGRYIVFTSSRSGLLQIWRMDADGGNPKQLTDGINNAAHPSLSSDGNWIYYNMGNNMEIWKVSLEGGEPVQVSSQKYALSPSISPDGKLIAYVRNEVGASKPWRVEVMSAENGEMLKVFDFPGARNLLVWTADSKSLISMSGNWLNLWEHPLDGSPPRQLTDFQTEQTSYFAISPDSQNIAFSRGNSFSEAVLISGLDLKAGN